MKTILIIEDDPVELKTVVELCSGSSEELNILTTVDEENARSILKEKYVDLIICNTTFSNLADCLIITRIVQHFPYIPLIAIAPPRTIDRSDLLSLGVSAVHEKPLNGELLIETLKDLIERSSTGTVKGMPTHSFLQMLESEGKTCTLQIFSINNTGLIFLKDGIPVDAETDSLSGEQAIYDILSWDEVTLEIRFFNGQRKNLISKPLISLIMEGIRLKDEREAQQKQKQDVAKPQHKLKQVSTAGQRLALDVGLHLKLEFDSLDSSLNSSLAGMVPEKCIIVTTPGHFISTHAPLETGSAILVKYRYIGKLCLFRSKLLRAIDTPQHLLFLDYPTVIHYHEMRKAVRTATYMPCTIKFSDDQPFFGAFVDLSGSGGLCQIKTNNNGELPEFKIKQHVEMSYLLPGFIGEQQIEGNIRNIRTSSTDVHIGIQFSNLDDEHKEAIEHYLSSVG